MLQHLEGDTTGTGDEDTTITGTLTASDPDGLTNNFTVSADGANGSATIDATGNWSYTPDTNFNGSDSFTVTITDDDGNAESQDISVTVNPVNDAGSFTGNLNASGNEDGGNITGTLKFTDTNDGASNPNFTVSADGANGSATIDAVSGAWIYTPNTNFNGDDTFTDDDCNEPGYKCH